MRFFRYIWFLSLLLVACEDGLDIQHEQPDTEDPSVLSIAVHNQPIAKAMVEGAYMPDGADVGVFLRNAKGGAYDKWGLQSLKYTSDGTGDSQTWRLNNDPAPMLSTSHGTAYAYYPYVNTVNTDMKVPITNDGTDWMYSTRPVTDISVASPVAHFEMTHAMTIVRCELVRGT